MIDQIYIGDYSAHQKSVLPPASEGYVFTPVCLSFCSQGGVRDGGMRGRGVCMTGGAWWGWERGMYGRRVCE